MSASDDVLSFEEQLKRLILEAVDAVEHSDDITNRCAYVLGWIMGPVNFTREERRALDVRIHRIQSSASTNPNQE